MSKTFEAHVVCVRGCRGKLGSCLTDGTLLVVGFFKQQEDSMAQNITKSAKALVQEAIASTEQIAVEDAIALVGNDTHVFVDLRDGTEQAKTGLIPGAVPSSRGMMEFHLDPESPVHKPELNQDKTYVFYCASGGRSALAAKAATEMGLSRVLNLSDGIGAWKKAGGPLE